MLWDLLVEMLQESRKVQAELVGRAPCWVGKMRLG